MAKLIISRPNTFIAIAAPFNIYIDGKVIDKINNNKTKEIELPAGEHKICSENALVGFGIKAKELTININDSVPVRLIFKPSFLTLSGIKIKLQ